MHACARDESGLPPLLRHIAHSGLFLLIGKHAFLQTQRAGHRRAIHCYGALYNEKDLEKTLDVTEVIDFHQTIEVDGIQVLGNTAVPMHREMHVETLLSTI